MRRSAVLAGSVRRVAEVLVLGLGCASPALAGDQALIDLIGYSVDGRYFAFEEFGTQDGSGFPYSNIYVLDLPADKWVGGSPFRVRIDDEAKPVAEARQEARKLYAGPAGDLGITEPARLIALNGDGEFNGDGKSLKFGAVGIYPGEVMDEQALTLETFPAPSTEPCESYTGGDKPLGFALTLSVDGKAREVHRDATLPKSRGCPTHYRLYGVVTMEPILDTYNAVAIVSVYPFGFEGPDRRFIAVPLDRP